MKIELMKYDFFGLINFEKKILCSFQSAFGVQMKVYWGSIESATGIIWCSVKWIQLHSIEPWYIFIWTPEALWNEPGPYFQSWKNPNKTSWIFFLEKAINFIINVLLYYQKIFLNWESLYKGPQSEAKKAANNCIQ